MKNISNDPNVSQMVEEQARGYPYSFLPQKEPDLNLPEDWQPLLEIAKSLPYLVGNEDLYTLITKISEPAVNSLLPTQYSQAKFVLGLLSQAYVWQPVYQDQDDGAPRTTLPAKLARPLVQISALLNEPSIFNYADYALRNWRKKDASLPIYVDNLETLLTFSGTDSEIAFIVVHVAYEAVAGEAIRISEQVLDAAESGQVSELTKQLGLMADVLEKLHKTFIQVRDIVSPDVFRYKIRMFLKGWKNLVPIVYEDTLVDAANLRGETGSESSVIPYFDELLGTFSDDWRTRSGLKDYLPADIQAMIDEYLDFRNYMPAMDRQRLRELAARTQIRETVLAHRTDTALIEAYNRCLQATVSMRLAHAGSVGPYIGTPEENRDYTAYGTGGADYRIYLNGLKAINESAQIT
uniref:Indoleamine 2,3-dioxygenase n=1 Tax=Candidatus Kentrum sp. TUN TaxID=2126343 RepID=A0A450ZVA7_9GAMM|nr:MAG: indoleamine 2,3-dioxygenase [Candidatus Kentron sp. TUN]VFK66360.1 MAG: indoleamine 2,3-dioxygenase [Candidatus Kentron sp. TUN]